MGLQIMENRFNSYGYLIVPYSFTDKEIVEIERFYGYKCIRTEPMESGIKNKKKLNWRDKLKSNGVRT